MTSFSQATPTSPDQPLPGEWRLDGRVALLIAVAHVGLGIAFHGQPMLAMVHALATVAVALAWAWSGRHPERVACAGAYIVGAEVLWRMGRVPLFWEFGKYALATVFIVATLRSSRRRLPLLSTWYFVLLLPGAALTFLADTPSAARAFISFNLSGPCALAAAAWFFAQQRLSSASLRRVLLTLIVPVISIATFAAYGMVIADEIVFTTESNVATSGGFGPNQVSAILGLGALIAFVYAAPRGTAVGLRVALTGLAMTFAAQSMMTFSRGGLYNAAGAALVGAAFLLRDARSRATLIPIAAAVVIITHYVLLPRMDEFTNGNLRARFESADLTGRGEIASLDMEIWADNPLFGIGVGQAGYERERTNKYAAAHTEYTRMLAEHGLFGLSAMLLLLAAAILNVQRVEDAQTRAVIAALTAWALIFMLDKAMRLSVPAFALGLAFGSFGAVCELTRRPIEQLSRRLMPGVRAAPRLFAAGTRHVVFTASSERSR